MKESIIDRTMEELKNEMKGNESFLSEGDFQYSFAKTVEKLGGSKVVIEYPYDLGKSRRHADVSFVYEGKRYFVELKYKTMNRSGVVRHGEKAPDLKKHAAESDNLYSFYSDIEKMEELMGNTEKSFAFCIFLTNNHSYWANHNGVQNRNVSLEDKGETNSGAVRYSNKPELLIKHPYGIKWLNFKDDASFKYLVIEIKPRTGN